MVIPGVLCIIFVVLCGFHSLFIIPVFLLLLVMISRIFTLPYFRMEKDKLTGRFVFLKYPSSTTYEARFVSSEDRIHLFVKKPGKLGYQTQQDFNLFDAGVALSHMLVTAEDQWFDLEYQKLDSILEKEFQNYVYVGSLLILNDSEKI